MRGDAAAAEILETNARYFAYLIGEAARQTPSAKTVIISGGLFTGQKAYADMVIKALPSSLSVIVGHLPQCIGACLGAAALLGLRNGALRDALIKAYNEYNK